MSLAGFSPTIERMTRKLNEALHAPEQAHAPGWWFFFEGYPHFLKYELNIDTATGEVDRAKPLLGKWYRSADRDARTPAYV